MEKKATFSRIEIFARIFSPHPFLRIKKREITHFGEWIGLTHARFLQKDE